MHHIHLDLVVDCIHGLSLHHLPAHEVGFLSFFGMLLDEVGEEENAQDDKDDEQFDEDNRPQGAPERHALETLIIEVE